jgi:hypothetical protein
MGKHRLRFSASTTMVGSICSLFFILTLCAEDVAATSYYISPKGKDSNSGISTSSPWLTFTKALATMRCGDTLNLMDGMYGDGTSTGKPYVRNMTCTSGAVLTVRSLNQRKAWIKDAGRGRSLMVYSSAYVTVDGIVMSSRDSNYDSGAYEQNGMPLYVYASHHIVIKNVVLSNPNRYGNLPLLQLTSVSDILIEDSELYNFHRHAINTSPGTRVTIRRVYCNPRIGGLAGGYPNANGTNGGDACIALYPCQNCIVENVIADGYPKSLHLIELNANGQAPLAGNRILGSIGYKTGHNGIYINSRGTGLMKMPQNTTLENVVIYNHRQANAIRNSDAKNTVIRNVTLVGAGSAKGILTDQSGYGDGAYSTTMQNALSLNHANYGVSVSGVSTWSGNEINSHNNRYVAYPVPPAKWSNLTTSNPALGACTVWIPDGSPMKRAGVGGADVGANVLYRYQNGVLTNVALWNKSTGAFPHGALVPGLNNIAGQSLYDVHIRLNINRNGCSFPAAYKNSATALAAPTSAMSF